MAFTLLRRGQLVPVPPVETALAFLEREGIALDHQGRGRRTILGTPDQVRAEVEQVARDYGAQEAIVVSIVHDHAARMRSYELIAEAFAPAPLSAATPRAGGGCRPT
jgi:alkanesulfonate monooxygenase SsuD/methylene tetrahydromethanopterin reductase-like flavin-dependent oxidoreductase (luciferase family)